MPAPSLKHQHDMFCCLQTAAALWISMLMSALAGMLAVSVVAAAFWWIRCDMTVVAYVRRRWAARQTSPGPTFPQCCFYAASCAEA